MSKTYYLAINRKTHQYFIGHSKLDPWYSFRYEHKTLVNAGEYKDYVYYQFDDIHNLFHTLDGNLNIVSSEWSLLNNRISIRHQLKDYLNAKGVYQMVLCDKTPSGYIFTNWNL